MILNKVFLGWGPGGNTALEAAWFQENPKMIYWKPEPFSKQSLWSHYTNDADKFLDQLAPPFENRKNSLELITHSFGVEILFHWIRSHKRLPFQKIKVLSSNVNSFKGYENLGIKRKVKILNHQKPSSEDFWNQVQALVQFPDLFSSYWSDVSSPAYHRYQAMQVQTPHFDFEQFQNIMNAFLKEVEENPDLLNRHSLPVPSHIPFEVYLGSKDPLVDAKEETLEWKKAVPNCTVKVLPLGHFIHLEDESVLGKSAKVNDF